MNTYTIYLGAQPITSATNTIEAYDCFETVKAAAEMSGCSASLVWDETGEVIAYIDFAEDDDDLECGFDPYLGCYTDDC